MQNMILSDIQGTQQTLRDLDKYLGTHVHSASSTEVRDDVLQVGKEALLSAPGEVCRFVTADAYPEKALEKHVPITLPTGKSFRLTSVRGGWSIRNPFSSTDCPFVQVSGYGPSTPWGYTLPDCVRGRRPMSPLPTVVNAPYGALVGDFIEQRDGKPSLTRERFSLANETFSIRNTTGQDKAFVLFANDGYIASSKHEYNKNSGILHVCGRIESL